MSDAILLVADCVHLGGVTRVMQQLWRSLPAVGVKATMMISTRDEAGQAVRDAWFAGDPDRIVLADLGGGTPARRLMTARSAIATRFERIVNLHFNTIEGTSLRLIAAARAAGKRVVVTYHHLDAEPESSVATRLTVRASLMMADEVIVSTSLLADRVRWHSRRTRVSVVPLGVEELQKAYDRSVERRALGVPEGAFVVGHLSRLLAGKGVPRVVQALRRLRDSHPNVWLLACGTPDRDTTKLRQLLADELPGRSLLLEFVEDHHSMLACCDVLAVPSAWEGFGLVYVEAAMHGVPRIATRMGGVPFVIRHGIDGILIDLDDIDALASAIAQLHDDPDLRHQMGDEAKRHAESEFTARRMAERYAAIVGER